MAEHASARFGGEASLPLHIFRSLRRRGVSARLVVHSRTRDELNELFPNEIDLIHYIPDTRLHRLLMKLGHLLPSQIEYFSLGLIRRLSTQFMARRIVKALVDRHEINVVHQPIPVSPKEPSVMHNLGAPVVIGPMNGGMTYPPAFRKREGRHVAAFLRFGRSTADLVNRLMPGKLRAATLLVANERTRLALPRGAREKVVTFIENGVDLSLWEPAEPSRPTGKPVEIIFLGRLIPCKAVDLLLEAFREVQARTSATLSIVGDGPLSPDLKERAEALGLGASVRFFGWMSQKECARVLRRTDMLVLPSLHECGGAVVLEAMATGLPVIAANWGGPADYLDETCGVLVDPDSERSFVVGLTDAMLRLAGSPELRQEMGRSGRERVVSDFDWEKKIEKLLEIYEGVLRRNGPDSNPDRSPLNLSNVFLP